MWENETECGIYATRFIMSWVRMGGTLQKRGSGYDSFEDWLRSLKVDGRSLSDRDVDHIMALARNGKLELECSAKEFLKTKNS